MRHVWRLVREASKLETTMGALYCDGERLMWTVEDVIRERPAGMPWKDMGTAAAAAWVASWKVPKQTAIPAGRYRVVLSLSARFKRVTPELLDVPGFSGIRMHRGNFHTDTEGCQIVGFGRGRAMIAAGTTSPAELELFARLHNMPEGDECWIQIENPPVLL
jgi:hypothetical protein